MGSCVSIHRESWYAIKPSHSPESKTENLVIIPSPIKNERPIAGEHRINTVSVKSLKSSFGSAYTYVDYGSKDEVFFDSQAWLDSDCEDDYFSVNGDFTPSRGNTPVHHKFSPGINEVGQTHIEDQNRGSTPEPSPTKKKKRLSELFMESFRDNLNDDDEDEDEDESRTEASTSGKKITQVKSVDHDLARPPKFHYSTPRVSVANSVCSSERTATDEGLDLKEKPIRSAQCCLPGLVSYRGFSGSSRRRTTTTTTTSPSVTVNA